jgi:hypothetical protein
VSSFTESVVEQAALAWLESIGWRIAHGPDIAPDMPAAERRDYSEVVLPQRLLDALARLNPDLPAEALEDAFRKLTRPDLPAGQAGGADLLQRNRALHRLLVNGVTVEYRTREGEVRGAQAQVLDFDDPAGNDWLAVGVPRHPRLPRPADAPTPPPSPARIGLAAGGKDGRAPRWHRQAREPPHAAALVRDAPDRGRPRHPERPGTARAPGREHHHDLHPRFESRAGRGEKPGGPHPRPMTSPPASAGIRVAICCTRPQPISTPRYWLPTDASGSVATSNGHRRAWPAVGIGCKSSQGLQH